MEGRIEIQNSTGGPVDLEVTRQVVGTVTSADHDGVIESSAVPEDASWLAGDLPPWWWRVPGAWHQLNGVARIRWTVTLEAGKSVDLTYAWNYYWH